MVQNTRTLDQAKVGKKGNLVEGQTLLLSFFSGDMRKSSHNGATECQNH